MDSPHAHDAPLMLSVSGCRGIVGRSLTPEVVRAYIRAVITWMRRTERKETLRVVLGDDGRRGGTELRVIAAAAMVEEGCDVIDVGTAMTPTIGVMVVQHRADGGITLTASHNPGEWNGVKVITRDGSAPDAAEASEIIRLFRDGGSQTSIPRIKGRITSEAQATSAHAAKVLAALAPVAEIERIRRRRFKVVLDSVNASGAEVGKLLLEALGCELVHLNAETTGIFPHPPEPTAENLSSLRAEITRHRADIGFAQDPDGDRLAIIDEQGRYIGEEYTLVLAAMCLLSSSAFSPAPGGGDVGVSTTEGVLSAGRQSAPNRTLVANLSTSRMLDDVAEKFGATVARSAVGEANVVSIMNKLSAPLGGEGNGGVIWPEVVLIRDSLSAMALTLALMEREAQPLSVIIASTPTYAIEKRKIELRPGLAEKALAAAERIVTGPHVRIDRQDGVRLDFPAPGGKGSAWLHIRASNTEPILRLIAEAPTQSEAKAILDLAQREIEKA